MELLEEREPVSLKALLANKVDLVARALEAAKIVELCHQTVDAAFHTVTAMAISRCHNAASIIPDCLAMMRILWVAKGV